MSSPTHTDAPRGIATTALVFGIVAFVLFLVGFAVAMVGQAQGDGLNSVGYGALIGTLSALVGAVALIVAIIALVKKQSRWRALLGLVLGLVPLAYVAVQYATLAQAGLFG